MKLQSTATLPDTLTFRWLIYSIKYLGIKVTILPHECNVFKLQILINGFCMGYKPTEPRQNNEFLLQNKAGNS